MTKTEKFTFDAENHLYFLNGKPLTGVTTVLGVIAKPALIQWAANEACKYAKDKFEELIKEGQFTYDVAVVEGILNDARTAHRKKKEDAAQKGTDIHAWIEGWIKDNSLALPEDTIAKSQAEQLLAWVEKNRVKFLASEKRVYSKEMWVAGTLDFIAEINGKKFMGDFKTYNKIYDRIPFFQMAAYRMMAEEMGDKDFAGSVIVNMPKGGQLEEKYSFDEETDKKGFHGALAIYRALETFK